MRVVLLANTDWYLYNFRLPLAEALRRQGHAVVLISPPGTYGPRLQARGFDWHAFDFARRGINPLAELVTLLRLYRLYRRLAPDLCHHFTVKCVLYGGIVGRMQRVPTIAAVTGLGHVFTTESPTTRWLRPLLGMAYRLALKGAHVIFQNEDDRVALAAGGMLRRSHVHLIPGSGVDVGRFAPPPQPPEAGTVVMIGRLLQEKGVEEFVQAAGIVRALLPGIRFVLIGDADPGNPSSIDPARLRQWREQSQVHIVGHVDDVRPYLHDAWLAVLPSYREGLPRSLVEAAACGLPLVAADVPGSRDICRHGDNGLLVPPRDAAALADAVLALLRDPVRRAAMGQRSREIAVAEYAQERVIGATLAVYRQAADIDAVAPVRAVADKMRP